MASVLPAASAKVAMRPVASSDTVPAGFTQGAAQVTVKLDAPPMAAIASLKFAVMSALLMATPVALLAGATAVTEGAVGPAPVLSKPSTGSRPPPPPPQAASTPTRIAASHGRMLWSLFICSIPIG